MGACPERLMKRTVEYLEKELPFYSVRGISISVRPRPSLTQVCSEVRKPLRDSPSDSCCCCCVASVVSDSMTPGTAAQQAPVPGILQARALERAAIPFPTDNCNRNSSNHLGPPTPQQGWALGGRGFLRAPPSGGVLQTAHR